MAKLKLFHRYLLGAAGIVAGVSGMTLMVSSILRDNYTAASISAALAAFGMIILAISFAD